MKKKIIATLIGCGLCLAAQAAEIFSKNVVGVYTNDAVWNPSAPGAGDIAIWSLTGNSARTNALGGDASWLGIGVSSNILRDIVMNQTGSETLTLGSAGIDMSQVPNTAGNNLFTINPNVALGAAQIWDVAETSTGPASNPRILTINGAISGGATETLTKSGAGALTLTGDNTYAGGLIHNDGTLTLSHSNALGTGTFTIGGGTLTSAGGTAANNTYTNAVVINGDFSVTGNSGGAVPIFTGDVSLGTAAGTSRTITETAPNSGTGQPAFKSVISDGTTANKIVKKGTGGIVLQGANTFTGGVDLDEGVLVVNHNDALGTGTLSISNTTTLSVAGINFRSLPNPVVVNGDFTIGLSGKAKLALSGAVDLGGSTRTITIGNVKGDMIPGIVSNGGLIAGGVGALTLGGTNTYAGGTTVLSGGMLIGAVDGAFGAGDVTVAGSATLVLTNGVSNDYINDAATLILDASSVLSLDFTNAADIVSAISLDGGSTFLSNGVYTAAALTGLGTGTYTGTGSLSVGAAGYDTWASGWGVGLGAATDDYDNDGLLNIYEYGLGGDPTNAASQGHSPGFRIENLGGTNYFGYVHAKLKDANSGISYKLALTTDLVNVGWTTNSGYIVYGTYVAPSGDFDYVTNVTTTVESAKFIRLIIEQL